MTDIVKTLNDLISEYTTDKKFLKSQKQINIENAKKSKKSAVKIEKEVTELISEKFNMKLNKFFNFKVDKWCFLDSRDGTYDCFFDIYLYKWWFKISEFERSFRIVLSFKSDKVALFILGIDFETKYYDYDNFSFPVQIIDEIYDELIYKFKIYLYSTN